MPSLGQVLRKEWGFKGFVVSDANSVGDLVTTASRRTRLMQRYVRSQPGVDMEMSLPLLISEVGKRTRTVSRSMLTKGA